MFGSEAQLFLVICHYAHLVIHLFFLSLLSLRGAHLWSVLLLTHPREREGDRQTDRDREVKRTGH